jgi:DNA modification methylase
VPELAPSSIKRGDLFSLGDHRLMCGDSTVADDVSRLLDGARADLVWTDPPYGVAYQADLSVEQARATHRRTDGLEVRNDALTPDGTRALVAAAVSEDVLRPGGCFYVASPSGDMEIHFRLALVDAGLPLREAIVWVKDQFVFGRQDYHWRHESILYGWRDGEAHYFAGGRTQDTVWEIARPKRSDDHPTMKPVELVERAVQNSSRPGETVYDPFSGSGTTILACERTGRSARAMEIDPQYVAVAIKRWEQFTGRQAVQVGAADGPTDEAQP